MRSLCLFLVVVLVGCAAPMRTTTVPGPAPAPALPPPPAPAPQSYSREFHGVTIEDPFHWLRDPGYPEVDDAAVLGYLREENAYFERYLAPRQGLVDALNLELKARQPKDDASVPVRSGEHWIQWRYDDGNEYRTWYWAPANAPDAWAVLLDENALAQGTEYFALGTWQLSPDGTLLAYTTDTNGDEYYQLHVQRTVDSAAVPLEIDNAIGNVVWTADSKQLFYVELADSMWWPQRVHRLTVRGADAGAREPVFAESDSRFRVTIRQSQSREYLLVRTASNNESEERFQRTNAPATALTLISPRRGGHNYEADHQGDHFYIRTNDSHRNYRVVRVPINDPGERRWQTVIAPSSAVTIDSVTAYTNRVVVTQREAGLLKIRLLDQGHASTFVELPEPIYDVALDQNPQPTLTRLRLKYESMVTPETIFDMDLDTGELVARKVQTIPSGYDARDYVTERVNITARDGVEVPVSIVRPKDYPLDGSAPLFLYAYGAYGYAQPAGFATNRLSLLQRGFAYAIAHVRGGGHLGEGWYEAGKLDQRTNTFNDFVDAARGLIERGYGAPGRIAIHGGSAGGSLMGAVVNQAPDLWGAVVSEVPFVDVLNTILDPTLPLTPGEWDEWGNPIEDPEAFAYIRSYSPYDQLKAGAFPPMLVTAGLQDPRVTYWEPAKYVAKLRGLKQDDTVLLLKTNMGAGHGGASGRLQRLAETAEIYAFVLTELGVQ